MKKFMSSFLVLSVLMAYLVPTFATDPTPSTLIGTATEHGILIEYQEYFYNDGTVGRAYLYETPTRASGVKDVTEYYTESDGAGSLYTQFYIHAVFDFNGKTVSCDDWGGDFTYKDSQSKYTNIVRACNAGEVEECEVRFSYTRAPYFSSAVRHSAYLYCDADGNTSMTGPN